MVHIKVSQRDIHSGHRPWDYFAYPSTSLSMAICQEALEDQFQARLRRRSCEGKKARQTRRERASVGALIADAIAQHLTDAYGRVLSVSLANDALLGGAAEALNKGVPDRLYDLNDTGWLKVQWGRNYGHVRKTTFQAGPKLVARMSQSNVSLDDIGRNLSFGSEIELKGPRGSGSESPSIVAFKSTQETRCLQKEVQALNNLILSAPLSQRDIGEQPLDLSRRYVRRGFLGGAFNRGGRLKGPAFWLSARKVRRREALLIDGEPIAELDLKSATPTIAYALEGLPLPHDPYVPPEFNNVPRDVMKQAFMKFLWDTPKKGAKLPKEVAEHISGSGKLKRVLSALKRHNAPIAHYIYAEEPRGAELMFHESEVIIQATFRCFAAGVPVLPLHDALLVPLSKKEKARECFSQAFEDRLGVLPVIVQDWPKE